MIFMTGSAKSRRSSANTAAALRYNSSGAFSGVMHDIS
jgi:hypothetical protein